MIKVEVSINVNATPAQVWQVIEPVERHVDWMADAVAIRFVNDQRHGIGTAFLCDTKVGPIRLTDQMEITEWVPERVMGVRHVGVVTGIGRFTLTPLDSGAHTRFMWSEKLTFPLWLGGRLGGILAGKLVMRFIWRRNLRALKQIVESPR